MSTLFENLVNLYARTNIQYPKLKAVTLAQWMLESGRGTSRLATDHLNFGGLKWRNEMTGFAKKVLYTASDGPGPYCQFAGLEAFIAGYWRFIDRSPYSGWEEHTETGEEFIEFIGPIYNPHEGYTDKVLSLVAEAQELLSASLEQDDEVTDVGSPAEEATTVGTVVIDPGHGGTSKVGGSSPNNAISHSGIKEKTMTLELGLLTREALEQLARENGANVKVIMTRASDKNVGIKARANKAKDNGADLFLSIHFNGFNGQAKGVETWVRAEANGNVNFAEDLGFAQKIQTAVSNALKTHNPQTKDRGVKPDSDRPSPLGVLNDTQLGNSGSNHPCRACLVEVEFIDVKKIDDLLNRNPNALQVRRDIARAMAHAMLEELQA